MLRLLSRHWWVMVLRGLLALGFGVVALVWPGATVRVLVTMFGLFALVDGLFSLFSALTRPRRTGWWLVLVEAVMGLAIGLAALFWPQITALVLLYLIAAWAVLTGILELVVAFRLRREIEGETVLMLAGILSVALGILLALRPGSGLVALIWFVGAYALLSGVLLMIVGFRLRRLHQQLAA